MVKRTFRMRPDAPDVRKKLRFEYGPLWPGAYDLARAGTPIGVWIPSGDGVYAGDPFDPDHPKTDEQRGVGLPLHVAVVIDSNGELFELISLPVGRLVRWCLARHLFIHHALSDLVLAFMCGSQVGWLHQTISAYERGRMSPVGARPYSGSRGFVMSDLDDDLDSLGQVEDFDSLAD